MKYYLINNKGVSTHKLDFPIYNHSPYTLQFAYKVDGWRKNLVQCNLTDEQIENVKRFVKENNYKENDYSLITFNLIDVTEYFNN